MKAKFSKRIKYIPEFDGNLQLPADEQVVSFLQPLKVNDLLSLMDNLQSVNMDNPEDNTKEIKDLIDSCGDLLPKYCEITNLTDADGEVLTAKDITEYPYFLGLSAEILSQMAAVSMPSEEEVGNSNAQPGSPDQPSP
jgi:hypothetical protein